MKIDFTTFGHLQSGWRHFFYKQLHKLIWILSNPTTNVRLHKATHKKCLLPSISSVSFRFPKLFFFIICRRDFSSLFLIVRLSFLLVAFCFKTPSLLICLVLGIFSILLRTIFVMPLVFGCLLCCFTACSDFSDAFSILCYNISLTFKPMYLLDIGVCSLVDDHIYCLLSDDD